MGRKISAEIDRGILLDIARGELHKHIAAKYKVSPSYVSKIATGKKVPALDVPEPQVYEEDEMSVYLNDIEAVIDVIDKRKIIVSDDATINHLDNLIKRAIVSIKIYLEIIKKYKGE